MFSHTNATNPTVVVVYLHTRFFDHACLCNFIENLIKVSCSLSACKPASQNSLIFISIYSYHASLYAANILTNLIRIILHYPDGRETSSIQISSTIILYNYSRRTRHLLL
ncbi:hypothetical protein SETIT_9G267700v2 [Setaria italica]|uniref:Uncharacterized protein n=1 Tax=Setaria italica TaxID=4555 RepID=A0A368SL51_SETIT|nr:hypothetical protein SETIT_9G267700v2 [Setaria italica]